LAGVPFYLLNRQGLAASATEVAIKFSRRRLAMFPRYAGGLGVGKTISSSLDRATEGINAVQFNTKLRVRSRRSTSDGVEMKFRYTATSASHRPLAMKP